MQQNPPDQETPGFCSPQNVAGALTRPGNPWGLLDKAGATHQTRKPLGLPLGHLDAVLIMTANVLKEDPHMCCGFLL
jgi:hypothetical protein